MASRQVGATPPRPIPGEHVNTTATKSSILQTQAEQRSLILDEYFESTKLLQVIEGFMTSLATTYKEQLRLPANPYPELLKTIRMHELRQAFALESSSSSSASLELTAVAGQASTLSQFQVCSVEHERFELPIWGMRPTLERLTGANLCCLLEQVDSALQGLLCYKEFTDDDCRTTAVSALVGECTLGTRLPALPRCFFQLETHVFVSGVHLERTMAVFARFLLKQLHEAANAATTFAALSRKEAADYCGCVLCDGITITPATELGLDDSEPTVWTIERLKESRTAFITAIKTALVSNSRLTLKRFESANLPGSTGSYVCKVEQDCFFHFSMEDSTKPADSKNMKNTTSRRSFIAGSRAEAGIFFHAQGAVETAARFQAQYQAALEEEERKKQALKKNKQAAATDTQPRTEKKAVRPGFAAVLQETIGTLHRMGLDNEVFRQQTHSFVGCFAYALGYLVGAQEVLVEVLCHPKCTATVIPVLQAGFASLTMWTERFMEESSGCPPTSVLHPVHRFLLSAYRDAEASSALEDERQVHEFVEALRRVNELLLIVIRLVFSDFLGLVRATAMTSTDIQVEKDTTEVDEIDVLRALEVAVEERKYPASIVSEAVFAQAVIDSCLDVALESAVMNTVAVCLPPNPFIDVSNHLQVFALRQLVWRYEQLPTRPKGITKLINPGSLELFSVEGSRARAANARLLEMVSGDQVIGFQQWLMDHRIFFQGTYNPPKSSYSVAIIPMLLLFHPLLSAMPTSDKDQVLLQQVDTMEHYIVEGTEFAQTRSFFLEAVRLDLRRLGVACCSPAAGAGTRVLGATAQVLDHHGHVETSLDLSPSTADETLATFIEEAAQTDLLLQVVIQAAEGEASGDSDILTIHKTTKTYAFHHHSSDAASTTLLPPLASFRVLEYGVFFSKENALLCLKNLEAGGCHLEGSGIPMDEWTPYASEAFQHNDQFLLYELDILHRSASCTGPRQHRDRELATRLTAHSGICQLYSLEQAVRWLLDALQSKLQRLTSSKPRKGEIALELPPTTTFSLYHRLALRIISQVDRFVVPLNNQLQFLHDISSALATLRNCVTQWQAIQPPTEDQLELQRKQQEKAVLATPRDDPTAVIRDLVDSLRVTWMLVLFFRCSYQHVFFANADRKRGS